MPIFVVFRVADVQKMDTAMRSAFPDDHMKIAQGEWIVSANGSAKDVSDRLKVTPGSDTGPAMIFSMANYYGRATTEIWDWIKTKAERSSG